MLNNRSAKRSSTCPKGPSVILTTPHPKLIWFRVEASVRSEPEGHFSLQEGRKLYVVDIESIEFHTDLGCEATTYSVKPSAKLTRPASIDEG